LKRQVAVCSHGVILANFTIMRPSAIQLSDAELEVLREALKVAERLAQRKLVRERRYRRRYERIGRLLARGK
jgi:hypothetical protein